MKLEARPWEYQDLLDELQLMIDEQSDSITNNTRTTLCTAKAYLEEYFTGLEKGKLLKVPCVPGDTVFVVKNGEVKEMEIDYIYLSKRSARFYAKKGDEHFNFKKRGIGKDVFLNEKDAVDATMPF